MGESTEQALANTSTTPSRSALSPTQPRFGETLLGQRSSAEGQAHVLISPLLGERDALLVLVRELARLAAAGRRRAFVRAASAVGLRGPLSRGVPAASDELEASLDKARRRVGPLPHAVLRIAAPPRRVPGVLKATCRCARTVRLTRRVAAGPGIQCACCGSVLVVKDPEAAGAGFEEPTGAAHNSLHFGQAVVLQGIN